MTLSEQPLAIRVLARLARRGPAPIFLGTIAYLLIALYAPGIIGAALLLLLVAALLAVGAHTWRVQSPGARLVRVLALSLLAAVAAVKLL
ncbi:hypothetical protein GCM10010123_00640 [Pilimelia anulata]|uniref:Uncharacterized protein n=1 Tax=Pilimelia anulata TaxID=53371 RepID=A0A8J3B5Z8_9ACTN|nr:hypothetical protein [Pilimelia anulata]GGJ74507.1 hypothetical protein GCM10010123_00640 [Pilimelia anulata]